MSASPGPVDANTMSSITLFTIPKAFKGDDAIRQRNAIGSWLRAFPGCQILLFGDDPGVAEAAVELGVEHVPGIECNDFGTPLLSWAFDQAKQHARSDTLGYANADIIFLPGTLEKLSQAIRRRCFIVGQRTNVCIDTPIDFSRDWSQWLAAEVIPAGVPEGRYAFDYFIFPRSSFESLPAFAVGRPGWDNWMVWRALCMGLKSLDVSAAVTALHQDHGYAHVKGARGAKWDGPEGDANMAKAGGQSVAFFGCFEMLPLRLDHNCRIERQPFPVDLYGRLVDYHLRIYARCPSARLWMRLRMARLCASGWGGNQRFIPQPGRSRQALLRWLLVHVRG